MFAKVLKQNTDSRQQCEICHKVTLGTLIPFSILAWHVFIVCLASGRIKVYHVSNFIAEVSIIFANQSKRLHQNWEKGEEKEGERCVCFLALPPIGKQV